MGDFLKKIKIIISVALFITSFFCFTTTSFAAQVDGKYVTLGGETFGVKFYNDGVIIVQLEDFYDGEKYVCPAKSSGLAVNDIIKKANGNDIKSNEDLQKTAYECNGEPISIEFERNGEILERKITPIHNTAGSYLLGAWVRDSCAGIGTITYYDTDNNYFAALGHGICDNDTNALLPLGFGEVVHANISSVTKSITGKAGSLNGYFTNITPAIIKQNFDFRNFIIIYRYKLFIVILNNDCSCRCQVLHRAWRGNHSYHSAFGVENKIIVSAIFKYRAIFEFSESLMPI